MPLSLSRRTMLRGAGVCLALPLLDAMRPAFAAELPAKPRRMVAIETNMGILPQFFFPEKAGWDYERIARRAYELYEQRGRQEGRDVEDWMKAEQQLAGEGRQVIT